MATGTTFTDSNAPCKITSFFVAGINYKKTDSAVRGMFAVGASQYQLILSRADSFGINSLFILSTCNRTEIYGFANHPEILIELLCSQTTGTAADFVQLAYVKNGRDAAEHLFNVAAGLDSQLLGDYEIVGQLKQAVKFAKERNFINSFIERLFNDALQASKSIKNETALSDGTVSVSFAAIQYIKEHIDIVADKHILLIGTGKIGRNTCKNLIDYLGASNITLINRTEEKSIALAAELRIKHAQAKDLNQYISAADIIITATNAEKPIILSSQLQDCNNKLIIDLAVPHNVEEAVGRMVGVRLINVDELSKLNNLALEQRKAEVPKAKAIINLYLNEFMKWNQMRDNVPALKAIKLKLAEIASLNKAGNQGQQTLSGTVQPNHRAIQTVVNNAAIKMRTSNNRGCHYIQAINEFVFGGYC
jgi:glutamyl-tRNA reductase